MRLSSRGRYAVMAMVEMVTRSRGAAPGPARPVSLAEIAAAQSLSPAYLEQLFGCLRRAGLVESARGPGGGYRLARPDGETPVASIIEAVDEPMVATRCEAGEGCLAGRPCATHALWEELGAQIRLFLGGVTLADVVRDEVRGRALPPSLPPARSPDHAPDHPQGHPLDQFQGPGAPGHHGTPPGAEAPAAHASHDAGRTPAPARRRNAGTAAASPGAAPRPTRRRAP
ncbi:Rrf2 family transcriptional regulator [Roseomonas elaeocarpi]